jgi:hypothetical protein
VGTASKEARCLTATINLRPSGCWEKVEKKRANFVFFPSHLTPLCAVHRVGVLSVHFLKAGVKSQSEENKGKIIIEL